MGRSRGRRVALWSMLVALVVLAGAAFVCRDAIVDEWQIRQLRSDESETRRAAALTLGERRSERAVPALIDLLRGDPSARDAAQEALVAIFPHASPERAREVVAAFLGVLRQDDELRRLADVIGRTHRTSSSREPYAAWDRLGMPSCRCSPTSYPGRRAGSSGSRRAPSSMGGHARNQRSSGFCRLSPLRVPCASSRRSGCAGRWISSLRASGGSGRRQTPRRASTAARSRATSRETAATRHCELSRFRLRSLGL